MTPVRLNRFTHWCEYWLLLASLSHLFAWNCLSIFSAVFSGNFWKPKSPAQDLITHYLKYNVKIMVKKVKVFHSLIAVGAVVVSVPLYLGHSWWKAEPIPLLSLPYPSLIRKRYPFTAGLIERVFQSSQRESQPRTHPLRRLSAPYNKAPLWK